MISSLLASNFALVVVFFALFHMLNTTHSVSSVYAVYFVLLLLLLLVEYIKLLVWLLRSTPPHHTRADTYTNAGILSSLKLNDVNTVFIIIFLLVLVLLLYFFFFFWFRLSVDHIIDGVAISTAVSAHKAIQSHIFVFVFVSVCVTLICMSVKALRWRMKINIY